MFTPGNVALPNKSNQASVFFSASHRLKPESERCFADSNRPQQLENLNQPCTNILTGTSIPLTSSLWLPIRAKLLWTLLWIAKDSMATVAGAPPKDPVSLCVARPHRWRRE